MQADFHPPRQFIIIGFIAVNVIFAYLLDIIGFVKLPWNIDTACMATFFFSAGQAIRKKDTLQICEHWQWVFSCFLLTIGLVCAQWNPVSIVDFDSNHYGNLFLMLTSALSTCVALLLIFKMLRLPSAVEQFLSFLGRNTIIILGFNYTANSIMRRIKNLIIYVFGIEINWLFEFLLVTIILSAIILIINKTVNVMRSRKENHYA